MNLLRLVWANEQSIYLFFLLLTIAIFVALSKLSCESLWFPGIVHDITSVTFSLHYWLFSHGPSGTPVSSTLFSNACFSSDNILNFRLRFTVFSF